MITGISIENFKGIGAPVTVEMRPITLLFGANSAGKSTILQALIYLHSILEHRSAATDTPSIRSRGVDFGGFGDLVHDRDLMKELRIDVTFNPSDDIKLRNLVFEDAHGLVEALAAGIKEISVQMTVAWSGYLAGPQVRAYSVQIDGVKVAGLQASPDGANIELVDVNELAPFFPEPEGEPLFTSKDQPRGCLAGERHALPRWGESLVFADQDAIFKKHGPFAVGGLHQFDSLIVGAGSCLREELSRFLHIGPVRSIPPRTTETFGPVDATTWSTGLGAWAALARDSFLAHRCDRPLRRLGVGYGIATRVKWLMDQDLARVLANLDQEDVEVAELALRVGRLPKAPYVTMVDDKTSELFQPADLGVGISQVVPVVAATALERLQMTDGRDVPLCLVAIEQPELHLHPAAQTGLGDLFGAAIRDESGQSSGKQFLIETHSEHLILRLLRRIRETAEGTGDADAPTLTPEDVAVYWVERVDGKVMLKQIGIGADGEFTERWPHGFFAERLGEL